jgi:hypothetical protein
MLSDLKDKLVAIVVDVESVENLGKSLTFELDIDDGTNDLVDLAITDTGSAGKSLPCGGSEERSRADCAKGWARSPADGGDATVVREKTS